MFLEGYCKMSLIKRCRFSIQLPDESKTINEKGRLKSGSNQRYSRERSDSAAEGRVSSILAIYGSAPVVVRLLHVTLAELLDSEELPSLGRSRINNACLSTRGGRLGIVYPPIAEVQIKAIHRALIDALKRGNQPNLNVSAFRDACI